jgi:hypothetical protein
VVRFQPGQKRGPRFRAPNSGYSRITTPVDSDQKSASSAGPGQLSEHEEEIVSKQDQSGSGPKVAGRKETKAIEPRVCQPDVVGCDIGAREIFVAVPADRDEHPVRKCGTFTGELREMAEWLVRCRIKTVAMESTGIYWIPVYDVFEAHGIEVRLANPRNMKNVPGNARTSTNASGFSICIRWVCCRGPSGRTSMFAPCAR